MAGCGAKRPVADHRNLFPTSASRILEANHRRMRPKAGRIIFHPNLITRRDQKVPKLHNLAGFNHRRGQSIRYGVPFHGRRASNGEIYDMHKLTAAHRTMPFETMVRVTNLNNGKSTTVRITDRGPFVDNRVIDLSLAAAREIESIGPGVVPVRLEVLGNVDVTAGFFTIQVGAFRERANAERLRDRLSVLHSIYIQTYDSPTERFTVFRG
jgi:rare lipoprotein A